MRVGLFRGLCTGAEGTRRVRALSYCGSALVVLIVAASAPAGRPASSGPLARVPSTVDCRTLLARTPAAETRPAGVPPRIRLLDVVSEFVERSVPDGQRYLFPTASERARFQCGFQFAAARQLVNARRLLQPLHYDVKQLIDTADPVRKALIVLE